MRSLSQVVFDLDDTLVDNGIRYAIGGALALAQYADPRVTSDVDVTVGTAHASADALVGLFGGLGWQPTTDPNEGPPVAGTRFVMEGEVAKIDVFFSFDDYHDLVLANAVRRPFLHQGVRRDLPVLAADDLAVMKLSFNRPKDWTDLDAMLDAGTVLDAEYITRHLVAFKGPRAYPLTARFRAMVDVRAQEPRV